MFDEQRQEKNRDCQTAGGDTRYPKGAKIPNAQIDALNIRYDKFHRDWNYAILPKPARPTPKW